MMQICKDLVPHMLESALAKGLSVLIESNSELLKAC